MSLLVTIAPDEILRMIRRFLDQPGRGRADTLQGALDHLVERCLDEHETELALALYALAHFQDAGLAGDAAGLLASRLLQLPDRMPPEVLRGIVAAGRELRACRVCGCTDAAACPGGCRWVEDDLCSVCATYPFPACLACNATPPTNAEACFRTGWTMDGVCPHCKRKRRIP
jgi:hypothetical protein